MQAGLEGPSPHFALSWDLVKSCPLVLLGPGFPTILPLQASASSHVSLGHLGGPVTQALCLAWS